MKAKVIITGAAGMLGQDLCSVLQSQWDVYGLSREELDITQYLRVDEVLKKIKPAVVINAAAYTQVDNCETNQEEAYRVNALGPRNLSVVCQQIGASLVQISTDYVFDGKGAQPYDEYSPTNPLGVYGKSKLAGEELVKTLTNRYYIIRTAWLYGKNGNNFVKTILRLAAEREYLTVVDDQTGCPTYTKDLAVAIAELLEQPGSYGVYHFTNSGSCTWYEFAREILKIAGIEKDVRPIKSHELNRPAPRPHYSVLANNLGPLNGVKPLREWQQALKEFLNEIKLVGD
ncbi:dTDP-4-dehydrorhamnose reductase [Carboxydocella sp. JDF658]|uniref:dTDP-4-dehydrorhamnose reductase n=1 Tax=Carboxydocella sp. JDF658 TaxID=1926600 RepID=UPI0009AD6899|nr:dTDP-4-dehydrorhamnose reductase [Carboxydocella sp. JDF658]GAW31238.1 NAD(P)-dependent oxidoreductase [Carboxydocella sp. JDF658]